MDGIVLYWNKGAERLFGYSSKEMLGKSINILAPLIKDEHKEILEKYNKGEKLENYEKQRIKKDGSLIDVSLTVSPIFDDKKKVVGFSTVARDISERKKAENALQKNNERFFKIFDINPIGMVLLNLETTVYEYVNEKFVAYFGYTKAEVIGKTSSELNLSDTEYEKKITSKLRDQGKIEDFEILVRKKNGEPFWALVSVEVITMNDTQYVLSSFYDITKRKKAEEELLAVNKELESYIGQLAESEEKFKVVLDSAQIGAWDLNLVRDTTWRSLLHDKIFGYDHLLPEWGYEIFITHVIPEDREYVKQRFEEAYSKGKFSMECRIKKVNDNSICWISAQGLAYKNEKGELTKI